MDLNNLMESLKYPEAEELTQFVLSSVKKQLLTLNTNPKTIHIKLPDKFLPSKELKVILSPGLYMQNSTKNDVGFFTFEDWERTKPVIILQALKLNKNRKLQELEKSIYHEVSHMLHLLKVKDLKAYHEKSQIERRRGSP
jgi:hypothetical protein